MNGLFSGLYSDYLSVRVGSSYKYSGGQTKSVKRIIQNQRYNSDSYDFDVALLELAEDLTFTNEVQPVVLAASNARIADGTKCLVSGWGDTKNSSESNEILRATVVPTVNQFRCRVQYRGGITPRMICAGYQEGGQDSCQGLFLISLFFN